MKICYISEKPSVSRLIEDHYRHHWVGANVDQEDSLKIKHITRGSDSIILIPLAGHILHLLQMNEYPNGTNLTWRSVVSSKQPFIPEQFEVQPRPNNDYEKTPNFTQKLIKRIAELTRDVDEIVNVGDPDEEGQFLVDEVFDFLRSDSGQSYGFQTNAKFTRMFIRATDSIGVERAINKRIPNDDVKIQGLAAKGRSIADWLWGANLTMLATELIGPNFKEKKGDKMIRPTISVGRVQTPVLNLIYMREQAIENFVPQVFYKLTADLNKGDSDSFKGSLNLKQPELLKHLQDNDLVDPNNRLISKEYANELRGKFAIGDEYNVNEAETKDTREAAPLPLSLEDLQSIMSKKYKMSASTTLEIASQLYMAKLISYPRNNGVRHLPLEMQNDVPSTLEALFSINEPLIDNAKALVNPTDFSSKAWNDEKAGSHYGIIPTSAIRLETYQNFNLGQKQVYHEVVKYYLYLFMPKAVKRSLKATIIHPQDKMLELNVSESTYVELGYREAFGEYKNESKQIPKLNTGDQVKLTGLSVDEGSTSPPELFTSGTLVAAMEQVYKFVDDEDLRNRLKGNASYEQNELEQEFQLSVGIGTSATRGEILKTLQQRKFVIVDKDDKYHTTERGRYLLQKLPSFIKKPDTTARWQLELDQVRKGEETLDWFIQQQIKELQEFFEPTVETIGKEIDYFKYAREVLNVERDVKSCPSCGGQMRRETYKTSEGVEHTELICESCQFKEEQVGDKTYPKFNKYPTKEQCPNCKGQLLYSSGFSLRTNKPYMMLACKNCEKIYNSNENKELVVKEFGTMTDYDCQLCNGKLRELKGTSKSTGKPFHFFECNNEKCKTNYSANEQGQPMYLTISQEPCPNCNSKMKLVKGVSKTTGKPYNFYKCVSEPCGFMTGADEKDRIILNLSEHNCFECQSKLVIFDIHYKRKDTGEDATLRKLRCVNPKCKTEYPMDLKTNKPINPYEFRVVEGTQRSTRLLKGSECPKCKGEVSENQFASSTGKAPYYSCGKCRIFLNFNDGKFVMQEPKK